MINNCHIIISAVHHPAMATCRGARKKVAHSSKALNGKTPTESADVHDVTRKMVVSGDFIKKNGDFPWDVCSELIKFNQQKMKINLI